MEEETKAQRGSATCSGHTARKVQLQEPHTAHAIGRRSRLPQAWPRGRRPSPASRSLGSNRGHGSGWAFAVPRGGGGSREGRVSMKVGWIPEEGQLQTPGTGYRSLASRNPGLWAPEDTDSLWRPRIIGSRPVAPSQPRPPGGVLTLPPGQPVSLHGSHQHTENLQVCAPDSTLRQAPLAVSSCPCATQCGHRKSHLSRQA